MRSMYVKKRHELNMKVWGGEHLEELCHRGWGVGGGGGEGWQAMKKVAQHQIQNINAMYIAWAQK